MAESLKVRVFYLFSELLAHTFGVLRFFSDTGTVTASCLKTFFDGFYNFLVGVKCNRQKNSSLVGVDKFANAVVVTIAYGFSCNFTVFHKYKCRN